MKTVLWTTRISRTHFLSRVATSHYWRYGLKHYKTTNSTYAPLWSFDSFYFRGSILLNENCSLDNDGEFQEITFWTEQWLLITKDMAQNNTNAFSGDVQWEVQFASSKGAEYTMILPLKTSLFYINFVIYVRKLHLNYISN